MSNARKRLGTFLRDLLGRGKQNRPPRPRPVHSPEPTPRPEAPARIDAARERLLKEIPPLDEGDNPKSKKKKKKKGKKG